MATASIKPLKSIKCPNCGASVEEDCVRCQFCHSVLSVTACPDCYGPIFKGMKYCPDCGASVERTEAEGKNPLTCPRCEQGLTLAYVSGTPLHECGICGGIWLDTKSFQGICDSQEQQVQVLVYPTQYGQNEPLNSFQSKRFYIPCPECGELMNQKNFSGCSGVIVDLCKAHGIWLDRQELQKIIQFIQNGGLHKAREKELERLKNEQRRMKLLREEQSCSPLMTPAFYDPDENEDRDGQLFPFLFLLDILIQHLFP